MIKKAVYDRKVSADTLIIFDQVKRKLVKGSNERERTINIDEYLRLSVTAQAHLKPLLIVARNTGMRVGEICTLKWQYIDRENMSIRLPAEAIKEGEKTQKGKNIPINHHVKAVLDSQPRALHHDYVFTYKGQPIAGGQETRLAFMTTCKNAGIPYGAKGIRFADFRRSVKTDMVKAGVDKVYRDVILGHSLKGMDAHYIKPSEDDLTTAREKYTAWLDEQLSAEQK